MSPPSPHLILISLGSNIEREHHTRRGVEALQRHFTDVSLSSVYESEAVGFDGNAFYNLCAIAHTDLSIEGVCQVLKQIERDNGRITSEKKFAPRTLDLDLLTYDDQVVSEPIVLPREEIEYNAFVLQPLAELVPDHIHPVTGKSYLALWDAYDNPQQKLWPIEFTWKVTPV